MATSLLFIRKMVRDRLGIPIHDDYFPDPLIDANINLAILAVEEAHRWPWNETYATMTLPEGSLYVSVPEDWRATKAITDIAGPLNECVSYELDAMRNRSSARPVSFCIINDEIHFAPIGMQVEYTHYYYRDPKLLETDEDVIRLPAQHVGTIVAKACQLCSTREDDRPSAAVHQIEFDDGLRRMLKDVRPITRPAAKYIRPGSWT